MEEQKEVHGARLTSEETCRANEDIYAVLARGTDCSGRGAVSVAVPMDNMKTIDATLTIRSYAKSGKPGSPACTYNHKGEKYRQG